jgi:prepilin-type N-terminal cleavage/methylation domain-containing protein
MRPQPRVRTAFTLIELLVVIAIIAIVASLSLVVIAKVREDARKQEARREIHALLNAITEYHADTGAYPISSGVLGLAAAAHKDFTYGSGILDPVLGGTGFWSSNNSEMMTILLDREKYPGTGAPTVNFGHVKNVRKKNYLPDVDMVGAANLPGLGPDLVFRDPWGTPYIISFDLNFDDRCQDAFYAQFRVSQESVNSGFNGLMNTINATGASDDFEYHGGVMIWSLGPDRKLENGPANAGLNRDNVLSWK